MNRKTKIVATIGPKALEEGEIEKMVDAGVDIFRLNFSYGTHEEHERLIKKIKETGKDRIKPLAILQDLSGSGVRIGEFENTEGVGLIEGRDLILSTRSDVISCEEIIYVDNPDVPAKVEEGDKILLADGEIELSVSEVKGTEIYCKVLNSGYLKGGRSLAIVGKEISLPALTEKDRVDLEFGLNQEVDFVALSFVRSAEDIDFLRSLIDQRPEDQRPEVVAKIETLKAVHNFDAILEKVDAVMVARGDLAVEVNPEEVPLLQKSIIKKCNLVGKPVITATQMLESMVNSSVPTRAETSDVANAILDGTDAIMLSAETAIGKYPLEAIGVMVRTALKVEESYFRSDYIKDESKGWEETVNAITTATVNVSESIGAKLIVALTGSGFTARMISRHRSAPMVLAITDNERTFRKLSLTFGCLPLFAIRPNSLTETFGVVRRYVKENSLAQEGDRVVVAAGAPFDRPDAKINMLFVENI